MANSFLDMLAGDQPQPAYGGLLGALAGQHPQQTPQPPAFDLMSAGLAMMAASKGQGYKPSLGDAMLAGIQTGREQGQAAQDRAVKQAYMGMQMQQMQMQADQMRRAQQQQAAQQDARTKLHGGLDSQGITWNAGRQGLTEPQQMQLYAQADPEGFAKLQQQQREWEMKRLYEPLIAGQAEAARNPALAARYRALADIRSGGRDEAAPGGWSIERVE